MSIVLSVVALLLSLASLVWQAVTFIRSGPRVTVTCSRAMVVSGAEATDVLEVVARNAGRSETQVQNWFIEPIGQPALIFLTDLPGSSPWPEVLRAGHSLSWYQAWSEVARYGTMKNFDTVRPAVTLGSGRTVYGSPFKLDDS